MAELHFSTIATQADFVNMSQDLLVELLSSDRLLCVERYVFAALHRWVDSRDTPTDSFQLYALVYACLRASKSYSEDDSRACAITTARWP